MRRARLFQAVISSILGISLWGLGVSAAETGYYRWPAASEDALIFASEGDLWRLDNGENRAFRLTTHAEEESQTAISPDGQRIAFAASYDGAREAYVMPMDGGRPTQITFEGIAVTVRGWSPDGRVLYTSVATSGTATRVLRLVDPDTLEVENIPLTDATRGTFAGDGDTLFFTRFGLELSRDNALLYRGGAMSQLWRFDMAGGSEAMRLAADFGAPIRSPMWWRGRIYFLSDKDGSQNIWSMDENGGDLGQLSQFTDWQLRGLSLRAGVIHYQRGADLYSFDLTSNAETKIDIALTTDSDGSRLRWIEKPMDFLRSARLGARGERVALTARGRVALASPGPLRRVDFDIPGDARARGAVVGAKGKWVYAIIDRSERGEVWRYPLDGSQGAAQLTEGATAHIWSLHPSPDGHYLVHDDKAARLWKLDLDTLEDTLITQGSGFSDNDYGDFAWSKDGRYLALSETAERLAGRVVTVHDLENGDNHVVTDDKYSSYAPTFSTDGDWLYFISERNFVATPGAPWGDRNMGPQFDKRGRIFALALKQDVSFPFMAPDELALGRDAAADEPDSDKAEDDTEEVEAAAAEDAGIDWEGLAGPLYTVPVPPGNYSGLSANNGFLFVLDRRGRQATLKSLKIGHEKPTLKPFAANVAFYELSGDGKKLFYRTGGPNSTLAIVPAGAVAPKDLSAARLRTGDWRIGINPADEWRQMFLDAWRLHRDFVFDPGLRGVNWVAMRDKYLPLVDRLGHRSELNDLLGQMTAEIGILHSQVRAGEQPRDDEKAVVASLGATYRSTADGLLITYIYRGERELPNTLGPPSRPGVDVRIGDTITHVNGKPVASRADLSAALHHQQGQQVLLDLKRGDETHRAIVKPVPAQAAFLLRYRDWVQNNTDKVANMSDGAIGYLHLRAMGGGDIASFTRDFFAHNAKDGLIIDVRGNRGGNIESWILQQLMRKVWAFWVFGGDRSSPYGNMQETFRGHLVVLINETTYSDGETFAAGVKALDLAPLIGERTAGAGIWLSDRNRLVDGGAARVAESPQFGLDGRWLIEGEGISPDIQVTNMPNAAFGGGDAQLQAALDYLRAKIATEPIPDLVPAPLPPMGDHGEDVKQ